MRPSRVALLVVLGLMVTIYPIKAQQSNSALIIEGHFEEFHEGAVIEHDAYLTPVLILRNPSNQKILIDINNECPIKMEIISFNSDILWNSSSRRQCDSSSTTKEILPSEEIILRGNTMFLGELSVTPSKDIIAKLTLSDNSVSILKTLYVAPHIELRDFQLEVNVINSEYIYSGSNLIASIALKKPENGLWEILPSSCPLLVTIISKSNLEYQTYYDLNCNSLDFPNSKNKMPLGEISIPISLPDSDVSTGNIRVIFEIGIQLKEIVLEVKPSSPYERYLSFESDQNDIFLRNNAPFNFEIGTEENCNILIKSYSIDYEFLESMSIPCIENKFKLVQQQEIRIFSLDNSNEHCFQSNIVLIAQIPNTNLITHFHPTEEYICTEEKISSNQEKKQLEKPLIEIQKDEMLEHFYVSFSWTERPDKCNLIIRTVGLDDISTASSTTINCSNAIQNSQNWFIEATHKTNLLEKNKEGKLYLAIIDQDYTDTFFEEEYILEKTKQVEVFETDLEKGNEVISIEGSWTWRTTSDGGCWYLSSQPSWILSEIENDNWEPTPQSIGKYDIIHLIEPPEYCSGIGIKVQSVTEETILSNLQEREILVQNQENNFVLSTPTAITVTTSLSILSLIFGGMKIETIRMNISRWGWLALIGAVKNTKPRDGPYQRGRIIGYLEANPGVHFRALLNALDMSNGHLAYHLKVLEERNKIWKKHSGRKVLLYPASIPQNLSDDELPIPVFTPDPSSTQGKIMQLLIGDEEHVGRPMTQYELSARLKASQQLVSHHLKTLKKHGLIRVERRGVRNVYAITIQAELLYNKMNKTNS